MHECEKHSEPWPCSQQCFLTSCLAACRAVAAIHTRIVHPRLSASLWGKPRRDSNGSGKTGFCIQNSFFTNCAAREAMWSHCFYNMCLVQGHKPTMSSLKATSSIENDRSNFYATFSEKGLHGGVLSGIINSPCLVTALLSRKVKLRVVCKAVPLLQQSFDRGSARCGFCWASGPRRNQQEEAAPWAQPCAKDSDTNIITDNWFDWWERFNIKG